MKSVSNEKQNLWSEHIQRWQESGLTQQGYCREHHLAPHQFTYWKHKLLKGSDVATPAGGTKSAFVQAQVNTIAAGCSSGLTLVFPSGLRLTGIDPHNLGLTRQLLEALA